MVEASKPGFQRRPGETGLSVFDKRIIGAEEFCPCFDQAVRSLSVLSLRFVPEEWTSFGLQAIRPVYRHRLARRIVRLCLAQV